MIMPNHLCKIPVTPGSDKKRKKIAVPFYDQYVSLPLLILMPRKLENAFPSF